MERHFPKSEVAPQSLSALIGDDRLTLIDTGAGLQARPGGGGSKRDKTKAKAQRKARRRNR